MCKIRYLSGKEVSEQKMLGGPPSGVRLLTYPTSTGVVQAVRRPVWIEGRHHDQEGRKGSQTTIVPYITLDLVTYLEKWPIRQRTEVTRMHKNIWPQRFPCNFLVVWL